MPSSTVSRRAFLASVRHAVQGSCIALTMPMILSACDRADQARRQGLEFTFLGNADGANLAAMAARIVPSDETPGATEAGVIYFIDQVLAEADDNQRDVIAGGLEQANALASESHGIARFADLDATQQDGVLGEIDTTEFFFTLRFLTVAGMFAMPEHGGFGPEVGYELIGFDNRHAWAPPYGFYDADYMERGE